MRVFLAVIEDLYHFATEPLFSLFQNDKKNSLNVLPARTRTPQIPLLPGFDAHAYDSARTHDHSSGVIYFIGEEGVQLYADPVVAFDVVIMDIPYGEEVRLQKLGGRWGNVRYKETEGWVFKDVLRDQSRDVSPILEEGIVYDAQNEETKKLRLQIHDIFCGGKASLLLTDAEYVTYRLHKKGHSIVWSAERPRTPGTWQKILRGNNSVHLGIHPKTDSVMEYSIDDVGFVAFVEAVFPDDSIKVSGIGLSEDGMYSERMLSKDEWKELRPVFIEVY